MSKPMISNSHPGPVVSFLMPVYIKKTELNVCSMDYVTENYFPTQYPDPDFKLSIMYH